MQLIHRRYRAGQLIELGATWPGQASALSFRTTIRCTAVHPDEFVASVSVLEKQIFETRPFNNVEAADRAAQEELAARLQRLLAIA